MVLKTRNVVVSASRPGGAGLPSTRITADLVSNTGYPLVETDTGMVVPVRQEAVTDANGQATLPLWPNQRGSQNSSYRLTIWVGTTGITTFIRVPDGDAAVPLDAGTLITSGSNFPAASLMEQIQAATAALLDQTTAQRILAQNAVTASSGLVNQAAAQVVLAAAQVDLATTQAGLALTRSNTADTRANAANTSAVNAETSNQAAATTAAAVVVTAGVVASNLSSSQAASSTASTASASALVAAQASGVTLHYDTYALMVAGLAAAAANAVARVWADETRGGLTTIYRKETTWQFKRYENQYLVGSAPDQVPMNLHLGSGAYQDVQWIPYELLTVNPGTIAVGGRYGFDVPVPGATTSDGCDIFSAAVVLPDGLTWTANLNVDSVLRVVYINNSVAAWTPGAHAVRGFVKKWIPE